MHRLHFKTVTLPADEDYPFAIIANCYPHQSFDSTLCRDAPLTLLVLHSTSFHKEALEPMLTDLFSLTTEQRNIREAWIVECPNHGESAVHNQEALGKPQNVRYFSCERYAEAAKRLLLADVEAGPKTRLRSDKIIGIGHSLGGCAIVFLAKMMPIFASLVLLEPFLLPIPDNEISQLRSRMVTRAKKRTNSWLTTEDVETYLRKRPWDERVRQLYATYGICRRGDTELGVQYGLACTREQEVTMYSDEDGATKPIRYLNDLCEQMPVHVAFGDKADVIPKHAQETLVAEDRQFASIEYIAGAGHLVPQENPQCAARFIARTLRYNAARL